MSEQRPRRQEYVSKPQPTLKGFFAWAFDEYVRADDQDAGPVAAQIIEAWVRQSSKMLAEDYNISRERYRQEAGRNVSEFPRTQRRRSRTDGEPK
jgi:hypothetical protein